MNPNDPKAGSDRLGDRPRQQSSRLFTLRLWRAELGDSQTEWRGQLQQVVSGQIRYFRDWPTLIVQLSELLSATDTPPSDANSAEP